MEDRDLYKQVESNQKPVNPLDRRPVDEQQRTFQQPDALHSEINALFNTVWRSFNSLQDVIHMAQRIVKESNDNRRDELAQERAAVVAIRIEVEGLLRQLHRLEADLKIQREQNIAKDNRIDDDTQTINRLNKELGELQMRFKKWELESSGLKADNAAWHAAVSQNLAKSAAELDINAANKQILELRSKNTALEVQVNLSRTALDRADRVIAKLSHFVNSTSLIFSTPVDPPGGILRTAVEQAKILWGLLHDQGSDIYWDSKWNS